MLFFRFKTRNTYKRHVKTRHGKVLTTTGELLHLSEEDFEKVKTNRKKKVELNKEHILHQEIIKSQKHLDYKANADQQSSTINSNEEYNENTCFVPDKIGTVKEDFETFEICIESQSIKTETTETDMYEDVAVAQVDCSLKVEDTLDEVDPLEIVQIEKTEALPQESIEEHPTLIFETVDDVTPYVQYNTLVDNRDTDVIEGCQITSDIPMGEVEHQIKIVAKKEKDYTVVTVGNEKEINIQYIENVQESIKVPVTMISKTEPHSEDDSTIVENIDGDPLLAEHDGTVMNIAGTADHMDMVHILSKGMSNTQPKMTNTFRADKNGLTKRKKAICLDTPSQQAFNHDKQHNRLKVMHAKTKQIALPLWSAQEISIKNVKKIGKQSAILLLSNDVLKNSILSIGENVTAISTDKL